MKTYEEAFAYSEQNPYELVEFKKIYPAGSLICTGFFLNGKQEGLYECYRGRFLQHRNIHNSKTQHTEHLQFRHNGSVIMHYFSRRFRMHGEHIEFDEDSTIKSHYFKVNSYHIEELDYLLDADRDDAFYVTLALYGIDKEYTFQ